MRRDPQGYDPYNSATSHFFIKDEIAARDYVREINAARAKFGDDYATRATLSFPARAEIAELMPWENFPEGVNVQTRSIFD